MEPGRQSAQGMGVELSITKAKEKQSNHPQIPVSVPRSVRPQQSWQCLQLVTEALVMMNGRDRAQNSVVAADIYFLLTEACK